MKEHISEEMKKWIGDGTHNWGPFLFSAPKHCSLYLSMSS